MIVPVGLSPLVSVATSRIALPTGADDGVALVVSCGVTGVTMTVSLASEQWPLTALLLTSPS